MSPKFRLPQSSVATSGRRVAHGEVHGQAANDCRRPDPLASAHLLVRERDPEREREDDLERDDRLHDDEWTPVECQSLNDPSCPLGGRAEEPCPIGDDGMKERR